MRQERTKDEYGTPSVLETIQLFSNYLALFHITLLPSPLHQNTKSCGFYFYMGPGGIPSTTSSIQSSSSVAMTTTQPSYWSPCLSSSFSAKLLAKSMLLPECPSSTDIWSCHSRVRTLPWLPLVWGLTAEDLSMLCKALLELAHPHPTISPDSSRVLFSSKTEPLIVPWTHHPVSDLLPHICCSLWQEHPLPLVCLKTLTFFEGRLCSKRYLHCWAAVSEIQTHAIAAISNDSRLPLLLRV